ncbi:MAG: DNA-3-methyladenine glycosylase I [Trueperaceae bacterium]
MTVVGPDGRARCAWVGDDAASMRYHDREWGVPVSAPQAALESLVLETFQAGLSWRVVLAKREAFRSALHGFDPERLAACDEGDVARWMTDRSLIRHRAKLLAAIANARAFLELERNGPGLQALVTSFVSEPARRQEPRPEAPAEGSRANGSRANGSRAAASRAAARALRSRGFRYLGPSVVHAHMQATGLVPAHRPGCFRCEAQGTALEGAA